MFKYLFIIAFFKIYCYSVEQVDFYKEIQNAIEIQNKTSKPHFFLHCKSFKPAEKIFNRLSDELKDTKHIIFLFTWNNHLPTAGTKDFLAIVFDVDHNKRYYFYNTIEKYRHINITTIANEKFGVENLILENYCLGKIEYLKSLQNAYSSAEVGQDFLIQEVDINKKVNNILVLEAAGIKM